MGNVVMSEQQYYEEIEHLIKRNEINRKVRRLEENQTLVTTYWEIGKILVEAQGGSLRAKYGNELIKKWSKKLTDVYGKGYDATNLRKFRQFYLLFPKYAPVELNLTWTNYKELLPIKDENERNYYINLCTENNLSRRQLIKEIKSNSYERLIDKPDKIDIIVPKKYSITTNMKNPIIIEVSQEIKTEKDLELSILANLDFFFKQLGKGFTYVAHQYKIVENNSNYYIDILLFNIKLNCYVVVELKLRSLRKEDRSQIEFYMNLVDKHLKEVHHNKTIGIIITKESNEFIVNFVKSEEIIPLSYELEMV